ncbi:maternal protein tudor-like [Daktulosphaira vitifoliae]|uniref:maternal protein tudor-like n=1 Tax=Daktulosphaira vitifoliae TaxID=58002 RepID=UPI0021A9B165|nr:maternal protein tudor-like [Daktulosphaira vitifoliae]
MRVLYCQTDYICMTKVKNEQKIRFMENSMNSHYKQSQDHNYKPRPDELCAVKYSDGSWYRRVCIDVGNSVDGSQFYIINLIDWGESVSVTSSELRRLETFYMKHAPLAVKCIILDFKLIIAHQKNLRKLENNEYKCKINLSLAPNAWK